MEPTSDTDSGEAPTSGSHEGNFLLRSYQAEMVEESLRANIIVVMDTGSGKTHIAIERTRTELETCQPHQMVWFLAPNVALCEQQYEVFKKNLPGYGIQMLSGQDGVDHWTEQSIWDSVLHNVRIVMSTPQVLYDALAHAFVKMSRLALLIFDEAHHCSQKHPAHRILTHFYDPYAGDSTISLPKILGLSASPVMKADATEESLRQIESNMHATVKTPKKCRSELLQYVHQPELIRVVYSVKDGQHTFSPLCTALQKTLATYDMMKDPYVVDLTRKHNEGYDIRNQLEKALMGNKTYCYEQLKTLVTKSRDMLEELGPSATDWYLHQCMAQFEKTAQASSQAFALSENEKLYLQTILRKLPFSKAIPLARMSPDYISQKVETLVDLLVEEASDKPDFTGLVFVEQRVWVAVLAEILSVHPKTKDLLRVGTFVGTSKSSKRKGDIASFAEPKNQQTTLDDFRAGNMNLILATSVLEEGIDVSKCHLVICFERPKNLKSFVQRRGRARMQKSKYIIFFPEAGGGRPMESWHALEEDMKTAYLDDMRQARLAQEIELEEEYGERCFEVESTGARLTLDDALPHLHHFCNLLGLGPFVDTRPQFKFNTIKPSNLVTAEVILPISIDPAVRTASSLESWRTERLASKDAAFEAYKALYHAGLVNQNLLPVRDETDEQAVEFQIPDNTPSIVPTSPTFDPWPHVARAQQENPQAYERTMLEITAPGEKTLRMLFLTPVPFPNVAEFILHWNSTKQYTVKKSCLTAVTLTMEELNTMRSITWKILYSIYSGRMQHNRPDFLWLLAPCDESGCALDLTRLSNWNGIITGSRPASALITAGETTLEDWGLISKYGDTVKYIPNAIVTGPSLVSQSELHQLQMVRVPRRRDFLHPVFGIVNVNDAYTRLEKFSASECMVEGLPASYSVFALFFPSILHKVEVSLVAETLRNTLLAPVSIESTHLPLIVKALTSSAADEDENYQRLEFLGDCLLKFIATVHLMADNLTWPESYLTGKKGKIVSNGFLARATLAAGLDKFVITKRFTGAKWSPRYAGDVLRDPPSLEKKERSSKLIADVVESLIGTSYVIGGFAKAFSCVCTLLPLENWTPIPKANSILYYAVPEDSNITSFTVLQDLIGRRFNKKSLLLDALTHASYQGPNAQYSYERMEFLGDAVLDYIVSRRLYAQQPALSHRKMHAMRTAMANASFLAFRMFETTVVEETFNKATMQPEAHERALWQFLRSGTSNLVEARDVARRRHEEARVRIASALDEDAEFPWHLLALTDAPKFLSDIVESVIGAIYIDSHGDILACEDFVRRLGILDCLERILRDEVDCLHPKERLGHLAVEKRVQYIHVVDEKDARTTYRCQVRVGEETVGGVVSGLKRLNAETIAAQRANKILMRAKDVVRHGALDDDTFFDVEEGGEMLLEE